MRLSFLSIFFLTLPGPLGAAEKPPYHLVPWVSGLDRPVKVTPVPGSEGQYVVLEQRGQIRRVVGSRLESPPVLDIMDRVTQLSGQGDERGLLGIAFHPKYLSNQRLFLNYTTRPPLRTRISEFTWHKKGSIEKLSERVLLEIPQPYSNHNGGELAFGPDGFLYIGMGDGGSAGDPHRNAQNPDSFLGKMLRIDVDGKRPYAIPKDNPQLPGWRPEIFAMGLRNPWRFSFDRATGELWAGDVGQYQFEEVNIVQKGKNYGWNIVEGRQCYEKSSCNSSQYEPPVHVYGHSEGISITGGYVYRGAKHAKLVGRYLFGDYGSGKIWALAKVRGGKEEVTLLLQSRLNLSALNPDASGEPLFVDLSGGIYRLRE